MELSLDTPVTIYNLTVICSEKLKTNLAKELFNEKKTGLKEGTIILVNGKNIFHMNLLETLVYDGDTVSMFPPAGGG